jgi:CheY-like chemotaxis protein
MGINTPIIALTANAIAGAKEEFVAGGMNDLLTKPINKSLLFKMLEDWLPAEKVSQTAPEDNTATADKTASSGKEAIKMVQEHDFDIVFMDHMMPEMDGIEATEEIRKDDKYKRLTIIALTANAIQGAKEMFLSKGFNDFLSKPIELQNLLNILIKYLPIEKVEMRLKPDKKESKNEEIKDEFFDMLSQVTEINIETGLQRLNDNKDMYKKSLLLFHEKLMANNERMTYFFNNGDYKNFSITVHAVKSMLASVGAENLSNEALQLEKASKGDDIDYCTQHFPSFSGKLNTLHEQLLIVFPDKEEMEKEDGDKGFLKENVQKALEAVSDYNTDAGIGILNNILAYNYGDEINTLLKDALSALQQYQYEETQEILTKIISIP